MERGRHFAHSQTRRLKWQTGRVLRPPLVLWALALAAPAAAIAAAPVTSDEHYSSRAWPSVAHTTTVRVLLAAQSGHLWIGTSDGLVRFDGEHMVPLDTERLPGVVDGNIEAIFEASDGTIWAGARFGGLSRIHGGGVKSMDTRHGLPSSLVRGFAETPDRAIWIATFPGGVARLDRESAHPTDVNTGLPDKRVDAIALDASGVLWAGTRGGLARLDDTRQRWSLELGPLTSPARAFKLLPEKDGTLWVGTVGAGLFERRDGRWRRYTAGDGLRSDDVSAILRDRGGRLWVATKRGGLTWLAGDRFQRFSLGPLGPCDQSIEALAEDAQGGLWIGTESCGLHRIQDRPIRTLATSAGLPIAEGLGLHGGPDGTVWVGTRGGGMARIAAGQARAEPIECAPGLPCAACWDIAAGEGSTFWAVCGTNELLRWNGRVMARAALPPGLPGASMVALGSDGALWLAHERTVVRSLGGITTRITAQEVLAGKRILYQGPRGTMWIAADDGVAAWTQAGVQIVRFPEAQAEAETANLHEDRDGGLWLATKGAGVRLVRDGRASPTIGIAQGLPSAWVAQVLEDDHRRLWLSTSKGILSIDRAELEAVANGRRPRVQPSVYDGADGVLMRSEPFGHPAGWKGRDGRLWFATTGGVAVVHPSARGTPPPAVVLEELRLGADRLTPLAADGTRADPAASIPSVGPGPRDLHARFSALSLDPPETISFRHRLEGGRSGWTEAGPDRTAHYADLSPGRYQLLIAARHRDGRWSEQPARYPFVLRPPFYRTVWFAPLAVLGVGLVLVAAHRLRLARTRAALHAVMAERARIARDVHDTLAQAFVATSVQLECLHRALRTEDHQTMHRHLETARRMVKESLEEARRSVWVLRPQALERGLPAALESLVGGASGETVVVLEVTGPRRTLPPTIEANLLRVAQEGVANAYRHARASNIALQLAFSSRAVTLSVVDDGTGLDGAGNPVPPRERGLAGMKERVAEIGGTFSLATPPGGGTAIRVEVPA